MTVPSISEIKFVSDYLFNK